MASGTVLQRKDIPVPLCDDTIPIAGGGAVGDRIFLGMGFLHSQRSVQPFAARHRRLKLGLKVNNNAASSLVGCAKIAARHPSQVAVLAACLAMR